MAVRVQETISNGNLWGFMLALGGAATAAYVAAPSGSLVRVALWLFPLALAVVLISVRVALGPPEVRRPLQVLLAGATTYLAGSVFWYVLPVHVGVVLPFPSVLDVAFFGAYALYVAFLLLTLRRRTERGPLQDRLALIDAAILTLAVSAVLWVGVVEPRMSHDMPILREVVALAYPAVQLVLVALTARLAMSRTRSQGSVPLLLFMWLGGELVADIFYAVQSATGTFSYNGPLLPVWMLAYTGLAAFAVHPRLVAFLRPGAGQRSDPRRAPFPTPARAEGLVRHVHLGLLLLAALVPMVLAVLREGLDLGLLTVAAATFILALLRASLLAGDLLEQRRLGGQLEDALARLHRQHRRLTQLSAAVDSTDDAVIISSPEGLVLDWNRGAERLYGYSRAEALGQHVTALLPTRDEQWGATTRAEVQKDGHGQVERMTRTKDGSDVEIEATLSRIDDGNGQHVGFVGISRAITERKALERELAAHARRLDEAQRLARVGSFEQDLTTGRDIWSRALYRLLGLDEATTEPSYETYLERVHPDDRAYVERQNRATLPGQPTEYEARFMQPNGDVRWLQARAEIARDPHGGSSVLGTVVDITDRKQAEAELERLAMTDSLTGLANRVRFTALLESALDDAGGERITGLLLLDLDGFKDVNDGIGHHAGDLVLQEVGRRVAAVLRGGDQVARLGGDEFAVVLPNIGDVGHAIDVATTVLSCLESPFDLDGIIVHVGGSVGVALASEPTTSGALLKEADVAMYRAKTLSSRWAVFAPEQDDLAAGRLQMAVDLRRAIEQGELDVAYQPLVDTSTRRVSSFEALVRWHHPEKGMVPPDQFIPLAEQADLIVPLTRLVLRKATSACAAWRNAGHDLSVGVNLSVQAMRTEDPCDMVAQALLQADLGPEHLVLEITETSIATEGEDISGVLHALRELGVRLVIDDFGTGYSAMSYLKQLPVEEIKIDRSFISEITTDSRDIAIVRSLVRLAHSLSLCVVAEGVESLDALHALTELGCDYVQGYGIAHPMPEHGVLPWLAQFVPPPAARVAASEPTDLLIVDDSETIRTWLTAHAEEAGWRVRVAASAEDALAEVERSLPDAVILDHHMTGMTGIQSVPHLRARGLVGPILLFTAFLTEAVPALRVPLDVWPVSKDNADGLLDLLEGYRTSSRGDARNDKGETAGQSTQSSREPARAPH